jgi:hypothetical protein
MVGGFRDGADARVRLAAADDDELGADAEVAAGLSHR